MLAQFVVLTVKTNFMVTVGVEKCGFKWMYASV